MDKRKLVILIAVVVIIIIAAFFILVKIGGQPIDQKQALEILKLDARCGNPGSVVMFKVETSVDQQTVQIPMGSYWKSDVPTTLNIGLGHGPSNGCWANCYLNSSDKSKVYYRAGCT